VSKSTKCVNSRLSAVTTAAAQFVDVLLLLLLLHGAALVMFCRRWPRLGVLHNGSCSHHIILLQSTKQGPQCWVLMSDQ